MKKNNSCYLKGMFALFGAAALSISFFFLLSRWNAVKGFVGTLAGILMPFIIGGVLAWLLTPICNMTENWLTNRLKKRKNGDKAAKGLSILITLLFAVLVVFTLLVMVIPALLENVYSVLHQIPDSVQSFNNWAMELAGDNATLQNYINDLSEAVSTDLPEWINDTVLPGLQTLIGEVSAGVVRFAGMLYNLLIGIIVSVYLLGCRKTFARQGKKLLYSIFPKKWAVKILDEISYANRMFTGFISGRIVDSLIIGVICFVGMLLLRIPNPMLVSVITGVTNVIPFFGPYIGAIPSFLLILMVSPAKAVAFLIFILILQQFDGNILGPRILGNKTGLSSFWVLFSILLFGGLFGFVGMIIGVPVFAVIYDILRKLVNKGMAYQETREKQQR
ncbi:MAG: AI-2E family transporter [Lachnospiraceae bacterium]|nr:AI-2E family transporter [Lachnospiraceae bacterium]